MHYHSLSLSLSLYIYIYIYILLPFHIQCMSTHICFFTSCASVACFLCLCHCCSEKLLTLKVLNFCKFTSSCSVKPLWSCMGEVVPARTSPTLHLHPPSHCASIVVTSTLRVKYWYAKSAWNRSSHNEWFIYFHFHHKITNRHDHICYIFPSLIKQQTWSSVSSLQDLINFCAKPYMTLRMVLYWHK